MGGCKDLPHRHTDTGTKALNSQPVQICIQELKQKLKISSGRIPDFIINVVTGPALLAIPIYLALLLLIKLDQNPYVAEVVEQINQNDENIHVYYYEDITGDGIAEKFVVYNLLTNATIVSFSENGTIYDSWNLHGKYYMNPAFDIQDIDNNGIPELYAITITSGDSVFVNQTLLQARSNASKKKFVARLGRHHQQRDAIIEGLGFSDITGDGMPEYLFVISAGFTLQPRAVYAWDIDKDQILRSPYTGMNVKYANGLIAADVNKDNISEIFLPTWSTDNYKTSVPFSDTASYSLVLSGNLEFLYPPVLIAGPSSVSFSFPMKKNDTTYVLTVASMVRGLGKDSKAILFDLHGNKVDSIVLANMNTGTRYYFANDKVVFTSERKEETLLGTIENDLSLEEHHTIKGTRMAMLTADLDNDPEEEMILLDPGNGVLFILQDNLKTLTACAIPAVTSSLLRISIKNKTEHETRFLVQMKDYRMLVSYHKNPYYKWRFVYYLLLYGIIYLFLLLLQKIFLFRSNRRKIKEDRMISLQLQSVMNQLNPHFTFNAINTVGDSILHDRKQEAYENLTKLSELIRSSMDNAFQVHKTLQEEIAFTRRYLELEAVRFEHKLTYNFDIENKVDLEMKIPKMLLHLFVENAIKHGIFHKTSPGHISVTAKREKEETIITISDDGIGRKNSRAFSGASGRGLKILDDYLVLFRKNYHREIIYTIEDLRNDPKEPGTLVTIRIKN